MDLFFEFPFSELEASLKAMGQPAYRARQVWDGVYQQLFAAWQDFSTLPVDLRVQLESTFSLSSLQVIDEISSFDGNSTKYLLKLADGSSIESVTLRSDKRITLCISSQSGCPVGCVFCATGKIGLQRSLTSGEIIEQVIFLARLLKQKEETVNNLVIMGMGEPFLNYAAVLTAVRRFNDPGGMNIGARRITISTIGIPDKIRALAGENLQVNLAVSLHAPNDELRRQLVPLANKIPIQDIMAACHDYVAQTNRRVTYEYVLIEGVNDLPEHARELAFLLKGHLCHVNLIGLNATIHYAGRAPQRQAMRDFGQILLSHHIPTSIRNSQGSDIQAACGQLAGHSAERTKKVK